MNEMVHGMLTHLGYMDLSNDESIVQALANAIYQGFEIKGALCAKLEFTSIQCDIIHPGGDYIWQEK